MNIFVAGHRHGWKRYWKRLSHDSKNKIITVPRSSLDLLNQDSVNKFFEQNNIDQVCLT